MSFPCVNLRSQTRYENKAPELYSNRYAKSKLKRSFFDLILGDSRQPVLPAAALLNQRMLQMKVVSYASMLKKTHPCAFYSSPCCSPESITGNFLVNDEWKNPP